MTEPTQEMVERVARAICRIDGSIWRVNEALPFDALNNHWRYKAKAALKASGLLERVARLEEALRMIEQNEEEPEAAEIARSALTTNPISEETSHDR